MAQFEFTARDRVGTPQRGTLEADTAALVVDQLRARGWMVVAVNERAKAAAETADLLASLPLMGPRSIDVEISLQQIAVMLRGGLTLLSSLTTVAEQATSGAMRRIWRRVVDEIQEGVSFSDALRRHDCFPEFVLRLVRVGEQTGVLESVLSRGAQMMQSRREARRNLLTALAYPSVVALAAFGVTAYMVVYLIPKLGKLLESMGKELPQMTQLLMDIARFVQVYGLPIVGSLIAATSVFFLIYWSSAGRLWIDRWALRIPIIGRVFRIAETIAFSQTLSILLKSGITVLEALVTVEQMHYNRFLATCVRDARENVMQGRALAESLAVKGAYLPLLISMTAVAEQTGSLDDVLDEVARFHQSQLQAVIRQLSAWVTPVVIIIVGTIVGFVYIAFFLALFAVGS